MVVGVGVAGLENAKKKKKSKKNTNKKLEKSMTGWHEIQTTKVWVNTLYLHHKNKKGFLSFRGCYIYTIFFAVDDTFNTHGHSRLLGIISIAMTSPPHFSLTKLHSSLVFFLGLARVISWVCFLASGCVFMYVRVSWLNHFKIILNKLFIWLIRWVVGGVAIF